MPRISPKALVEDGATLADDVVVGPFTYVGAEVTIGPGCVLENNVTVVGRTRLGSQNHLLAMSVVGVPVDSPSPAGRCELGDVNVIREHVTVYAGGDRPTVLGTDNLVMIGSQVGPGAEVGDHGIFANLTQVGAGACVGDYVRTSGFALINERIRVGDYAFVSGHTEIDIDAPPFAMIQGNPYRVRGVNTHNLKRCGFGDDDIRALKSAFRELFNGGGRRHDASAYRRLLEAPDLNPHVRKLLQAVEARDPQAGGDR
jgi:UDP-N-acetylglucosamine acyltransferase